MQADCTEWCNNPVFPYPWQEGWRFYGRPEFVIRNEKDSVVAKWHLPTAGIIPFAHMIGLDVESYRIKESYKSAVERYLSTIGEGQQLWEGSPVYSQTLLR